MIKTKIIKTDNLNSINEEDNANNNKRLYYTFKKLI